MHSAFGKFIKLGKVDIADNSRLVMKMFAKNVTFSAFNLVGLSQDRPKELDDTFVEVMDLIRSGELMPVKPVTTFDMLKV